ncbi:MAG: hypothetical protein R3223_01130 [Longimicrobiales bacterium]|nr:hypothetical protein [Longimicrobiales bacterium]
MMRTVGLAVSVAVLLVPFGLEGQSVSERLQGAWRVVEIGDDAPPPGERGSAQPGLLLFAGDHYSYTLITRPRPGMPQGLAAAEELLAVWNPFTANAGTFEISGDTMTRRPLVAKNPNAMGPGVYNEYTFRLEADTLWVTTVGTETGPARNPTTVRYERVR